MWHKNSRASSLRWRDHLSRLPCNIQPMSALRSGYEALHVRMHSLRPRRRSSSLYVRLPKSGRKEKLWASNRSFAVRCFGHVNNATFHRWTALIDALVAFWSCLLGMIFLTLAILHAVYDRCTRTSAWTNEKANKEPGKWENKCWNFKIKCIHIYA